MNIQELSKASEIISMFFSFLVSYLTIALSYFLRKVYDFSEKLLSRRIVPNDFEEREDINNKQIRAGQIEEAIFREILPWGTLTFSIIYLTKIQLSSNSIKCAIIYFMLAIIVVILTTAWWKNKILKVIQIFLIVGAIIISILYKGQI